MSTIHIPTWMSPSEIQNLRFHELKLPGTHDSATYSLTNELSQVSYPNIAFLWSLSSGSAQSNGQWPWQNSNQFAVGEGMYNAIMDIIRGVGKSQDMNMLEQLHDGIRYFDLRLYYDTRYNNFYLQHALMACPLTEVLGHVAGFIRNHPDAAEFIILNLSHTNFNDPGMDTETLTAKVCSLVSTYIQPENIFVPKDAQADSPYPFNDLGEHLLSDLTQKTTKVFMINTDTYQYTSPNGGVPVVTTTIGYANSNRSDDGVNTLDALKAVEGPALAKNPSQKNLYQVAWNLTAQIPNVIAQTIASMSHPKPHKQLRGFAYEINSSLKSFLESYPHAHYNLVTMDWYHAYPEQVHYLIHRNYVHAKKEQA